MSKEIQVAQRPWRHTVFAAVLAPVAWTVAAVLSSVLLGWIFLILTILSPFIRDCIAAFWGAAFGMVGVIWALSKWTPNAKPKIIAVEFWLICAGLLAFELLYMPASWDRLPALISVAVSASGALILFKTANGHEEYPVSVNRSR